MPIILSEIFKNRSSFFRSCRLADCQGIHCLLTARQEADMVSQIQSRSTPQPAAVDIARLMPAQQPAAVAEINPQIQIAKLTPEQLKQNLDVAITRLNEQMRDGGRNVRFSVDKQLGRFIVQVTKEDTGEVIRQIPNEAVLKAGHTVEALRGMLHNQVV